MQPILNAGEFAIAEAISSEHIQCGDILVVQAFGDPYTGTMGDMLTTYFKGRGGIGIVVGRDGAPSHAHFALENTTEVGSFLAFLSDVLR